MLRRSACVGRSASVGDGQVGGFFESSQQAVVEIVIEGASKRFTSRVLGHCIVKTQESNCARMRIAQLAPIPSGYGVL